LSKAFQKTLTEIQHRFAIFLYSDEPKKPKWFIIAGKKVPCKPYTHRFKFIEEKFGEACMMMKICSKCGYGRVEFFPPRTRTKVRIIA